MYILKYVQLYRYSLYVSYGDAYVEKLQEAIQRVKHNRELEERYMLFQELLDEREEKGRKEGRKEGIIEGHKEGVIEGRVEEIFSSVFCGDYSKNRGAEKLNLTIAEFSEKYTIWLLQKQQI